MGKLYFSDGFVEGGKGKEVMLTVAFMTNRAQPHFEWFWQSLCKQAVGQWDDIRVIMVDFWRDVHPDFQSAVNHTILHVEPKPTVWQGVHRLTKDNWFAAANARNTAICHAWDGYLVFVDDVSVLLPGWLNAVREAMQGSYCVFGAYKKVLGLVVENGEVKYFRDYPAGDDSRRLLGRTDRAVDIPASALYGCSFGCPVEAYLDVNGFNEDADGLGSEDSLFGICLGKKGYVTKYDLRMGTIESEEDHHNEPPFIRRNKGTGHTAKDFAILNMTLRGNGYAPNYFHEGSIRATRQHILNGGEFHKDPSPAHDWYDGQEIASMT